MSKILCIAFEPDTSGRQWVSIDTLQWKISGVESTDELFDENGEATTEFEAAISEYIEANKHDPKFAEEFCGCLNFDFLDGIEDAIEEEFDLTGLEYEENETIDNVPNSFYKLTSVEQIKRLKNTAGWAINGISNDNIILVDEQGNEL